MQQSGKKKLQWLAKDKDLFGMQGWYVFCTHNYATRGPAGNKLQTYKTFQVPFSH